MSFFRVVLVLGLTSGGWHSPANAVIYPTNRCVAAKQRALGAFCRQSLKAWAVWDRHHDDGARDAAITRGRARLTTAWRRAEAAAEAVDCAATTLPVTGGDQAVTTAVEPIVTTTNQGLDLNIEGQKQCGARLLTAAAKQCGDLLNANATLVKFLERDPHRQRFTNAQTDARGAFTRTFALTLARGCPTATTATTLGGQIDTLVAALVRDTTVSPHVGDAQYSTVSPTGTTTYLGKAITPTCMNSSPYHFFVKRGTVNKLVVYYQGGGACWEQLTCSVPVCDTSVEPNGNDNPSVNAPRGGFANLSNPNNPFKDWHAVFVSYCSCDIHFGDAAQDYPLHVEHRGFHNARIVEKWAREHFVNPDAVFVSGSSAGAYGAWFHAPLLHQVWPASKFTVLADAGNGVITQSFLDQNFPTWNFEGNLPANIPAVQEVFDNGTGIPGYTKAVANLFPDTTWAHYSTAFDGGFGGQTGFYNVMLNNNDPIAALTWWNGSCAFNAEMRTQAFDTAAAIPANYRYYIGTGSRHTMFGNGKVYNDTTGGVPTLVTWVNAMLASDGLHADPAWNNVECSNCGRTLPGDPKPGPPLLPPFVQNGPEVDIVCPGTP